MGSKRRHVMFRKMGIVLFLLSSCTCSYALYNGNPSFPMMPEQGLFIPEESCFGVKLGYQWDYAFDRRVKVADAPIGMHRRVQTFQSMNNSAVVTAIFRDRVEAYGSFGAMHATVDQIAFSTAHLKWVTNQDFAWECGGRVILVYWGNAQLGVDAKYFEFHPSMKSVALNGAEVNPKGVDLWDKEWQVGVSFAYRVKWFVPYIGLKHCHADILFSHLEELALLFPNKQMALKPRHQLGAFIGFGLCPKRGFNMNTEVRVMDETSMTLSGDMRF